MKINTGTDLGTSFGRRQHEGLIIGVGVNQYHKLSVSQGVSKTRHICVI